MNLSIIVPAHNEEENIADVIKEIETRVDISHELVVVNDHSQDETPRIVESLCAAFPRLRLAHNEAPGGFANALRCGFANSKGDVVVPIMGDLCDDLSTIRQMCDKIEQGFDIVCGCRYALGGKRRGGSKFKAFLSSFGGISMHFLLGIPTHDLPNAFKMYRKKVVDTIESKAIGFEISMEITLKAYYAGFKITEVPTDWKERTKGKSTFNVGKLLPSYAALYWWGLRKKIFG